ncbi:MAG: EpsI family protein [Deltaproteobacteria bacterium RBG_16_49_23]|nr:MAG: EpsI family protein [Deltaproteobacteria bacterium RBG_16_49_23]
MLSSKSPKFWIILAAIAAVGVLANFIRYSEVRPQEPPHLETVPYFVSGWSGQELFITESALQVLGADTTLLRVYKDPQGKEASLYIAYFDSQKYGSQIHSPKHCLPGGGWNIVRREKQEFVFPEGQKLKLNRMLISDGKDSQLMYYCFLTRSGILTNEFMLKADLVLNSVLRRPTDAAIIRVIFPLPRRSNPSEQEELANRFLTLFWPEIKKALPFQA